MPRVTVTSFFPHPAKAVHAAWLDQDTAGQWLFATEGGQMMEVVIDPRIGGHFRIVERRAEGDILHTGTYWDIVVPTVLEFTFQVPHYDKDAVQVRIGIVDVPDGCHLTLNHEVTESAREAVEQGWRTIFENLDRMLSRRARNSPERCISEEGH